MKIEILNMILCFLKLFTSFSPLPSLLIRGLDTVENSIYCSGMMTGFHMPTSLLSGCGSPSVIPVLKWQRKDSGDKLASMTELWLL